MNLLERYMILANPLTTLSSGAIPKVVKAAPSSDTWRMSDNPRRNLAAWNTVGVMSWAIPLAVVATALINSKAKAKVDAVRQSSDDQLLNASRPELTPRLLASDLGVLDKNVERLKKIDSDNFKLMKRANFSLFESPALATIPIVAAPATYWLASKLATKLISDKMENELTEERKGLRKLQDEADLERLELLGLVNRDQLTKTASDGSRGGLISSVGGGVRKFHDAFRGVDLMGLGKTLLWDIHLAPIFAASALLAIGGGMYMSGRDKSTKKVKLLTEKLLGENRMHDPAFLSIQLPEGVSAVSDKKQLQWIEGIPSSEQTSEMSFTENDSKKDELFN